jgi:hypothetical protein
MRLLRIASLILLSSLFAACPATTKVVLRNESANEIEVLSAYSEAVLATIAPAATETIVYNQDCFRVRSDGEVIGFQPVVPPPEYIEVRTFHVRIFGVFTKGNDLEITPLEGREGEDPNIPLKRGCEPTPEPT